MTTAPAGELRYMTPSRSNTTPTDSAPFFDANVRASLRSKPNAAMPPVSNIANTDMHWPTGKTNVAVLGGFREKVWATIFS